VDKQKIKRSDGYKMENVIFKNDNCLDVIHPTVIVRFSDNIVNMSNFNYMEIPIFTRYYFIESITANGGLVEITGRSDPLTSFKNDIKNSTQIIARTSNKNISNMYLTDNEFPIEVQNDYHIKNFGNAVSDSNCVHVILETAGKGGA
jgi:hypothetical protein